jgi:holo-[acyl-carrier protein] synthase
MIGNDIVDLILALQIPKTENIRFLKKICSEDEIDFILKSDVPELSLWRVWSMKESAYKIIVKKSGINLFIPKKIITKFIDKKNGKIYSEWGEFLSITEQDDFFLHTVTTDKDCRPFSSIRKSNDKNQSLEVRNLLVRELSEIHPEKYKLENLSIVKKERVPYLHYENKAMNFDISLSHHGEWLAYAFHDNQFI